MNKHSVPSSYFGKNKCNTSNKTDIMTPAVNILKKARIPYVLHQYDHDSDCSSYGMEAAEKLGMDPERVYKTLVTETDSGNMVVSIIPVSAMLDLKALAKIVKAKKMQMADKEKVERTTGYILGGVSPLGQKKRLKTVIDGSSKNYGTIFISGGRRGLDIELAPDKLAGLLSAVFAFISK